MAARCSYHCSPCGRHFHSLEAFDIHHGRDETGWPICLDPADLEDRDGRPRLYALTTDGVCDVRERLEGVTVWGRARDGKPHRRALETIPPGANHPADGG
jgi:hypothetical protein